MHFRFSRNIVTGYMSEYSRLKIHDNGRSCSIIYNVEYLPSWRARKYSLLFFGPNILYLESYLGVPTRLGRSNPQVAQRPSQFGRTVTLVNTRSWYIS